MPYVIAKGPIGSKVDQETKRTRSASSFTANGQNSPTVRGRHVEASISGTFVGTIQLQQRNNSTSPWFVVASRTDPGLLVYESPVVRETRLFVSAWTSGTAAYELTGGR